MGVGTISRRLQGLAAAITAIMVTVGMITPQAAATSAHTLEPSQERGPDRTNVALVALGDSYLAGIGAGDYYMSEGCRRSHRSAPALLAKRVNAELLDLTCPGATISSASRRASSIPRDSDAIIVQIGGNDMGFATLAGACLLAGTATCTAAVNEGHLRLPTIRQGVLGLVRQIRLTAPSARVTVLGYPRLLDSPDKCRAILDGDRVRSVNRLQRSLDRVLRSAALTAGANFSDWPRSVDRASLCSSDPWYALPGDRLDDLLHPDSRATRALARHLQAQWRP